ncbi:hypothetical protein QVA66_06685 [Staphylococcus chromogenes]|nr:hypothetical protein [Staphylococcus chromogenes]
MKQKYWFLLVNALAVVCVPILHIVTRFVLGLAGWMLIIYAFMLVIPIACVYLLRALFALFIPKDLPRPNTVLIATQTLQFVALWLAVALEPDFGDTADSGVVSPLLGFLSMDTAQAFGHSAAVGLIVLAAACALVYLAWCVVLWKRGLADAPNDVVS